MNRLLLGCFLPLLLLLPAQAQLRGANIRRVSSWRPVTSAPADIQPIVEQLVKQRVFPTSPVKVYRLDRLPDCLPTPIQLPAFPLPQNINNMYRGMALEYPNEQLMNIWRNGLEVSKCHAENFASYDGIQSPCAEPAIYASTDPGLALGYTNVRLNDPTNARFPVLFHLKRVGNSLTVSIPHDVPPHWIEHVSTVLQVDGQLRWGELKLNEAGQFLFIPYPLKNLKN